MPTFLSLFAGIGGFDLGLERAGFLPAGQIEIDPFCQRVLAARWPGVERAGDVRGVGVESEGTGGGGAARVDGHGEPQSGEWGIKPILPVDLLVGGFPCQDLSVAGKRAGLGGERSGLFWEIVRIAKAMRPPALLLENVPGLLSSNGGADIGLILDALHEAGYLTEVEECDSQHFGVAQRRRRLFFVGVAASSGLQKPTHFSSVTLAAVLAQSLLDAWELLDQPSGTDSPGSGRPEQASPAAAGLLRRMNAYAASSAPSAWPGLSSVLAERLTRSRSEPESWACPSGLSGDGPTGTDANAAAPASADSSTARSWERLWGDLWMTPSLSTISTWSSTTTAEKICTCAEATLHTFALTAALSGSCPPCWNAVSLSFTALLACIDSLGRVTDDLFVEAAWRDRARVLLDEAEAAASLALCGPTEAGVAQVLALTEGVGGDSQAGGEAWADVAHAVGAGAGGSKFGSGRDGQDDFVVGALGMNKERGGWRAGPDEAAVNQVVVTDPLTGNPYADNEAQHRKLVVAAPLSAGSHDKSHMPGRRREDDVNLAIILRDERGRDQGDRTLLDQTYPLHAAKGMSEQQIVTHALIGEGHDASEDGTGRETPLVIQDVTRADKRQNGLGISDEDIAYTVDAQATQGVMAFDTTQITSKLNRNNPKPGDPCHPLAAGAHPPAITGSAVRRLTPLECERLQGFPDGFTCLCTPLAAYAADPDAAALACTCPDSPRYRALGNAVTVSVVSWIGQRLRRAMA